MKTPMGEKWTRREAAGALLAAAARPAWSGQEPSGRDALAEARKELEQTRKRLREVELPEQTAPAFVFRP